MSGAISFSRTPTFNHVAMTVDADLLDASGRADILEFYGDVFGWTEMPTMTRDRVRLVLRAYTNEQFVYVVADPKPMQCPQSDHFGMSVGTPRELDEMLERARKFQARDARVEIVEKQVEDFKAVKLHNFYVRFLLPMTVEVQCFEWAPGLGAASLPGAGRLPQG